MTALPTPTRAPSVRDFYCVRSSDLFEKCRRFHEAGEQLRASEVYQSLYRVTLSSGLDHRVTVRSSSGTEREMICFDSNSYLHLHRHPRVIAWIVALLPAIGFLCGGASPAEALASSALCAAMVSVFCSYAVFVILGYLKDISADRATGYVTFPVRFGWRPSVWLSSGFSAVAFGASAAVMLGTAAAMMRPSPQVFVAWALWLAGVASLVVAHVSLLRTDREAEAHQGIAWSVRGFVLLHLGLAAALRPELSAAVLGLYALFEIVLGRRPERGQV